PRVTFSFDSCGWLMVYHFGVAHWLQQHMLAGVTPENAGTSAYPKGIAFSGSSGGALIAAVLGAGTHIPDVFQFFLEQHAECLENPCRMFPAVDRALRKFQYPGAHKFLSGRVRVLLTRVSPKPPFVMGEVVDTFASNEIGITTLCASCHVPLMAGILPYKIEDRYYYDGMAWPSSFLVPWRAARGDLVIRISAMGAPLSDIRVSAAPLWWGLLPPSISLLRGLFWMGYRDAAVYFSAEPGAFAPGCTSYLPPLSSGTMSSMTSSSSQGLGSTAFLAVGGAPPAATLRGSRSPPSTELRSRGTGSLLGRPQVTAHGTPAFWAALAASLPLAAPLAAGRKGRKEKRRSATRASLVSLRATDTDTDTDVVDLVTQLQLEASKLRAEVVGLEGEREEQLQRDRLALFESFDLDGDGAIDDQELRLGLSGLGLEVDGLELDGPKATKIRQALDKNGDGKLQLEEFDLQAVRNLME
ncbi:unnamed protein product, partial [Polarella glacialis]